MSLLVVILLILAILLIISIVWNFFTWSSIKKSLSSNLPLTDTRYFELKSRNDFMTAAFTFITGTIVFLGYNSLDNIQLNLKKDITDSLNTPLKAITDLSKKVEDAKNDIERIQKANKFIDEFSKKNVYTQSELQEKYDKLKVNSSNLEQKLQAIGQKDLLKQQIYIVAGLDFTLQHWHEGLNPTKYFYKDMKSVSGESLPTFNKPPIVFPITNDNGAELFSFENTKESIQIGSRSFESKFGPYIKFNLLIIESP